MANPLDYKLENKTDQLLFNILQLVTGQTPLLMSIIPVTTTEVLLSQIQTTLGGTGLSISKVLATGSMEGTPITNSNVETDLFTVGEYLGSLIVPANTTQDGSNFQFNIPCSYQSGGISTFDFKFYVNGVSLSQTLLIPISGIVNGESIITVNVNVLNGNIELTGVINVADSGLLFPQTAIFTLGTLVWDATIANTFNITWTWNQIDVSDILQTFGWQLIQMN